MVTTIMTERLINLVSPLAHKATDMRTTDTTGSSRSRSGAVSRLTTAFHRDYISSVAGNKQRPGVGTRMRRRSAASNMQCGYFFALAYLNGGPGGAAARLAGASSVFLPPFGLPPLRRKSGGGFNTATEATIMANIAKGAPALERTLSMHHSSVELCVSMENTPSQMLEQASLWLAACRQIFSIIADNHATEIGDEIWGGITLLELAKGLLDNASAGDIHG